MITIKRKKLEQVLEALESGVSTQIGRVAWTEYDSWLINEAITAIKEALAQPEQEPVEDVVAYHSDGTRTVRIAPKRPWVGLTDEDIEAAHGIKETKE